MPAHSDLISTRFALATTLCHSFRRIQPSRSGAPRVPLPLARPRALPGAFPGSRCPPWSFFLLEVRIIPTKRQRYGFPTGNSAVRQDGADDSVAVRPRWSIRRTGGVDTVELGDDAGSLGIRVGTRQYGFGRRGGLPVHHVGEVWTAHCFNRAVVSCWHSSAAPSWAASWPSGGR